jgi:predicted ATPase
MIRSLAISSFKAFSLSTAAEPAIPLRALTVLVGPNGAGKSTILQAIAMLGWLSRGPAKGTSSRCCGSSSARAQRSRVRS